MTSFDWTTIGPGLVVTLGAVLALMVDAFFPRRTWLGSGLPATAALVVAGVVLERGDAAPFTVAVGIVVLVGTVIVVLSSNVMNYENAMPPGELHFLLLAAAAGALVMVAARDFVTLVVALELLSLPSIALVGLRRGDRQAVASAWTFFLVSVVSTAVTLMGLALLYGATGSLQYAGVDAALAAPSLPHDVPAGVASVAVVLTVVGLLFKLGAVPFHAWVPDTYRGASVMVAGFLSAVSKAAAIGALVLVLGDALPHAHRAWVPVVAVVATLTMTVGNLGALRQRDAIGLLAWSSVAQAGFLLAPVAGLTTLEGATAPVQYLAVYALANLVAFSALAVLTRLRGSTSFDTLRGLIRTEPWLGASLGFAVLTLAGFPPAVIGLVTKYVVLRPVVETGHYWLAAVMAVNVALGLAYYLRLLVTLLDTADTEPYVSPSPPVSVQVTRTVTVLGALALVVLSVWPDLLLRHLP